MQVTDLVIPGVEKPNQALDLGNALMAVSGVGHISFDPPSHTLTVEFDERYLSLRTLKTFVEAAGYPSAGDRNTA